MPMMQAELSMRVMPGPSLWEALSLKKPSCTAFLKCTRVRRRVGRTNSLGVLYLSSAGLGFYSSSLMG